MGVTPQRIRRQRFRLAATAIFFACIGLALAAVAVASFLWQVLIGR